MTDQTPNLPATQKAQPVAVSHAQALFDTDKFVQMQRAAQALMHSTVLPESIRGNTPEQCFSNLMVAFDLADRLRTTPISVTQCMSIVHGKILLEGKLVQAAIDNVLGIDLHPWWVGERGTDGYRIFLSDKPWDDFTDEQMAGLKPGQSFRDRKVVDGSVGEWKTYGKDGRTPKPAWVGIQTQNQLLYRATREWARRYAPTIMLGVYTDDEIDAAEERRIDRGAVQVRQVQGLSGGFATQTAEKEEQAIVDAVVEDIVDGQEANEKAQEDTQDAEETTGTTYVAENESEALSDEERARLLEEARRIGRTGRAFAINMAWPEDFIAELEVACGEASAEYDAQVAAEAAAEQEGAEVSNADEETEVQTQGDLPNDDQAEATDQSPDAGNMIDAADSEGQARLTPVEAWSQKLDVLNSWPEIKQAIYELSTGPRWKEMTPEEIAEVRSLAWARMQGLIETTDQRQDFLDDLTAFRCWIEWYDTAEGIAANWIYLQETPHYRNLKADQRRAMVAAVEGRIEALGGVKADIQ